MKYIPLFILIQAVSLVLTIVGIPLCAVLAYVGIYSYSAKPDTYHFPKWAWLFDNAEDGVCPAWYDHEHRGRTVQTNIFVWSALRNSVANFKHVPGVSKVGRPLWRKTMGSKPGGYYFQVGWNSSGNPVLSGGRNVNVY